MNKPRAPVSTFSFDGEGIYEMLGHTGTYVYRTDYDALERTVAELEGLLREIRPQVDIVRGSWFDRADAALARLEGKEPP